MPTRRAPSVQSVAQSRPPSPSSRDEEEVCLVAFDQFSPPYNYMHFKISFFDTVDELQQHVSYQQKLHAYI